MIKICWLKSTWLRRGLILILTIAPLLPVLSPPALAQSEEDYTEELEGCEEWGDCDQIRRELELDSEPSEDEGFDEFNEDSEDQAAPTDRPPQLEPETIELDPLTLTIDDNPFNPAGQSLDTLIQLTINQDVWDALLGDLPCLDATERCVRELQEEAVANNLTLAEIDFRLELIDERIETARTNSRRSSQAEIVEPLLTDLVRIEPLNRVPDPENPAEPGSRIIPEEEGFLEKVIDIFDEPIRGINNILSFIGVPLFRNASGGSEARQARSIAIADLQVKVAEIERAKFAMKADLRETVMLEILEFDKIRREFQIAQEIARRDALRLEILDLDYRFAVTPSLNTPPISANKTPWTANAPTSGTPGPLYAPNSPTSNFWYWETRIFSH